MKFRNQEHKDRFNALLGQMTSNDSYHQAVAYLMTLDDVLNKHIGEIYNFDYRTIDGKLFKVGWMTSTSVKTYRLLLNLWNGVYNDSRTLRAESSKYYVPDEIFNSDYAPYYWEAIKLRFPWINRIKDGIDDGGER